MRRSVYEPHPPNGRNHNPRRRIRPSHHTARAAPVAGGLPGEGDSYPALHGAPHENQSRRVEAERYCEAAVTTVFAGPMFMPSRDPYRKSIIGKEGAHYNTYATHSPDTALAMLREWFADKTQINEMNFVLFSTSGVHGMYTTIEECERDIRKHGTTPPPAVDDDDEYHPREVTFLLVQPRIVGMTYGNCACRTLDDVRFLKRIRKRSWEVVQNIGREGK